MHTNLSLVAIAPLLIVVSAVLAGADSSLPCPGSPDADLWVLAGQSNMVGAGLITKKYKADSSIMMLTMDNKWIRATPPIHRIYDEGAAPIFKKTIFRLNPAFTEEAYRNTAEASKKQPVGGMGPDWFFAKHIVKRTGRRVVLIPCAMGATSMADWDPATKNQGGDSLYGNMMQRITLAGGKIKGILWYQGESDAAPGTDKTFETTFLNLVDSIRRDTGIPDLPFIYVQISRFCIGRKDLVSSWESVRETQRTVAGKRKNLFVVPAIDLPLDDMIHIGTAGHERLGARMAEIALNAAYNRKDAATAIDFDSCELLPRVDELHNTIRVRFKGVNGKLQSKGDPTGFSLRADKPHADDPCVFKVEFDPKDPAAVIIWYSAMITKPTSLYYGAGLNPYVNIVDSKDMAIPAFGPIALPPITPTP